MTNLIINVILTIATLAEFVIGILFVNYMMVKLDNTPDEAFVLHIKKEGFLENS